MEAISAAASGIAVASIAIQLADSMKKLVDFWESVQDAPNNIRSVLDDLRLLSRVLKDIDRSQLQYGFDANTNELLESCHKKMEPLLALLNHLQEGLNSKKRRVVKWAAIKSAFQEDKIRVVEKSITDTKVTILLARQCLQQTSQAAFFEKLETQVAGLQQQSMYSSRAVVSCSSNIDTLRQEEDHRIESEADRFANSLQNPILRSAVKVLLSEALADFDRPERYQPDHSVQEDEIASQNPSLRRSTIKPPTLSKFDSQEHTLTRVQTSELSLSLQSLSSKPRRLLVSRSEVSYYSLVGTITKRTEVCRISGDNAYNRQQQLESSSSLFFLPSPWIMRCGYSQGFHILVSRSSASWKITPRVINIVPRTSLSFEFSKTGNLEGLKSLFARNMASIWEIDPRGNTLLHKAAKRGRFQICKFLIEQGADLEAREHEYHGTPLSKATSCVPGEFDENRLSTIELLQNQFNFYDDSSVSWECLYNIHGPIGEPDNDFAKYSKYIMTCHYGDIRANLSRGKFSKLLASSFAFKNTSKPTELLLGLATNTMDPTSDINAMSSLHHNMVDERLDGFDSCSLKLLFDRGADLHFMTDCTAGPESLDQICATFSAEPRSSLTFIAMQRSSTFQRWREFLKNILQLSIEDFVSNEIELTTTASHGWTKQTLLALFQSGIEGIYMEMDYWPHYHWCRWHAIPLPYDEGCINIAAEPTWLRQLERIKEGKEPTQLKFNIADPGNQPLLCPVCRKYYTSPEKIQEGDAQDSEAGVVDLPNWHPFL